MRDQSETGEGLSGDLRGESRLPTTQIRQEVFHLTL